MDYTIKNEKISTKPIKIKAKLMSSQSSNNLTLINNISARSPLKKHPPISHISHKFALSAP